MIVSQKILCEPRKTVWMKEELRFTVERLKAYQIALLTTKTLGNFQEIFSFASLILSGSVIFCDFYRHQRNIGFHFVKLHLLNNKKKFKHFLDKPHCGKIEFSGAKIQNSISIKIEPTSNLSQCVKRGRVELAFEILRN